MQPRDTTAADQSIAKQLQAALERNFRMRARLRKMLDCWDVPTHERNALQPVIEQILKDEDPWHQE
jgi:hypothetical protein